MLSDLKFLELARSVRHADEDTARALRQDVLDARAKSNERFAARHEDFASTYEATQELRTSIRVALTLGRPLLLTGEPGTGKTLCAYWIAELFGKDKVKRFQVKSDSRAKDLLYAFDAAAWFRESDIRSQVLDKRDFLHKRELGEALGWDGTPSSPAVVLIDEIDKAPRDFPNDLLHELDQMSFKVEETGHLVECPANRRPIVVITSNSERQLPPPFLRRCVLHHIVLDPPTISRILLARLAAWDVAETDIAFLSAATTFWVELGEKDLGRKPTIDEYWRWLAIELEFSGKSMATLTASLRDRKSEELHFATSFLSPADLNEVFPPKATS
ncbi:AAA family ATPase [Xanthobacter aminoxidans]|uniref:AAA family ATPase n=1 Tax=Xanthobacter aminoxidans TaxID=186280 RepID=UPI00372980A2